MALTDNLISYYTFDSDATDSLGTNDCTVSGADNVAGKISNCYDFVPGSSDYIYKNTPTGIPVGGNARSFSYWIYRDSLVNGGGCLSCMTASGQKFEMVEDNTNIFFSDGVNGNNNLTNAAYFNTGAWIHVVFVVVDSTHYKLYINGSDVTAATNNTGTFGTAINTAAISSIAFGRRTLTSIYYDGKMDEIGIWARAITAAEVTELYNSGSGFQYPFTPPPPPTAAFTADVTSGYPPLTVTFTDTSTESPTAWSWEKKETGSYEVFSTDQNPIVDIGLGTWDIKLTATNAFGSDSEEKLDYITTTAKPITILPMSGTKHKFSNSWKFQNRWKFKFF